MKPVTPNPYGELEMIIRHLIFIISILSFSQANAASLIKCVDNIGQVFYEESTSKNGKSLMSVMACEDLSKHPSSEDLQHRTQDLLNNKTGQEREEALALLSRVIASIRVKQEEAVYRIKVRETAKFLDDVMTARERK
jgi:hypothetical protein